ncbi:hypothetical protein IAT40_000717 [Kwoniella sp. CBS 6097]
MASLTRTALTAARITTDIPPTLTPTDLPSDRSGKHSNGTIGSIEFDDSCVMVDTNPLSITEDGIRKKLSVTSISGSGSHDTPCEDVRTAADDKTTTCRSGSRSGTGTGPGAPYISFLFSKNERQPQVQQAFGATSEPQTPPSGATPAGVTRRRLSLSFLINLPAQPTTKLKALAKKLSSSPINSLNNQSNLKSTPAPPIVTAPPPSFPSSPSPTSLNTFPSRSTPKRASTMPVIPRISTSTIPSSPVEVVPYTSRKFTIVDMDREAEIETDDQVIVVDSKTPTDMVIQVTPSSVAESKQAFITAASHNLASSVCSSTLTVLDEDAAYSPPVPLTPQQDCFVPAINTITTTPSSRRTPFISRSSSFGDDLTALSEVDETDHHLPTSASAPPSPVAASTKVCSGIWLCSRPPRSSCPIQEVKQVSPTPTIINPLPAKKVNRPLVVRSMSTGRLASEFDAEGRVICLSVHSDRVLKPSVSPPPPSSSRAQCWMGPGSRSTPGLLRSQSYQASKRSPVSPSEPSLNKLGLPAPPVRSRSDFSKQSSTERLVRVPSSPASTLTRAASIGSWKKKAWQMSNRSVRV